MNVFKEHMDLSRWLKEAFPVNVLGLLIFRAISKQLEYLLVTFFINTSSFGITSKQFLFYFHLDLFMNDF